MKTSSKLLVVVFGLRTLVYFSLHPRLWWPALVVAKRFKPNKGIFPPWKFIQFRLTCMYGSDFRVARPEHIASFVLWAYNFPIPRRSYRERFWRSHELVLDEKVPRQVRRAVLRMVRSYGVAELPDAEET